MGSGCCSPVQSSLTLFLVFVTLFFFPSHSLTFSTGPQAWAARLGCSQQFQAWRGRPITSSYEDSTVPVTSQFCLRREESPHSRFCAFFTLATPTEPFMSHCQMRRIPHRLNFLSAWKIIHVSLSGKRAFPLRNHTSNCVCSARNFSIIAHIGASYLSLVCGALF